MRTAILIDGGFFLKRYHYVDGFEMTDSPKTYAENLVRYCHKHIRRVNQARGYFKLPPTELYRIYYYDAAPFDGDSRNPISMRNVSFKNTEVYKFQKTFHDELKRKRKIALRLGHCRNSGKNWLIKPSLTKKLFRGETKMEDLTHDDVIYPLTQKGVDMKVGLDIATLAFKEQVQQIILIAGDSDFVPAAKFARKEGVDLILDPMQNNVHSSLHEHIDGLTTIRSMKKSFKEEGGDEPT